MLYIEETWIDRTQNAEFGSSGVYETFTDNLGELYRLLVREYGRCIGKIHLDLEDGKTIKIGWIFQKRQKYEDCDDTFIAETWVSLHDKKPDVTTEYHFHKLG